MKVLSLLVLLLPLLSQVAGHYDGYPFIHQNQGKYGAAYPVANYGTKVAPPAAHTPYQSAIGYGFNHEYNYRALGEYPVHVGNGQFYYLGKFNGNCEGGLRYAFYLTRDPHTYVVCDHGRAHTFPCPLGTKNRDGGHFRVNHRYAMHELCGVNTNHGGSNLVRHL